MSRRSKSVVYVAPGMGRKSRRSLFPKPLRKLLVSVVILLVIIVAGGVLYTYIVGRDSNAKKEASIKAPAAVKNGPNIQTVQPAPNAAVGAAVQYIDSPVKAGDNVSLSVHTNPNVKCSITFTYNNVASKDSGLKTKMSDSHGVVGWTWTVDKATPPGKWPAKVLCASATKSGMVIGTVEVTK